MTLLSQHDLWGSGGNSVVALPPSPGDVFVITTLFGRAVTVQPIGDFDHAVSLAKSFTRHIRPARPITIKVLCLSLQEAQAMGFVPDDLFANLAPAEEAELRQLVVDACRRAILNSPDAAIRNDAMNLLINMGELK
ncbi:hypothetical protein [Tabrizicola fusiformis]|uniref:hypothetical protein n=1 Tax=Tabrizicola sp. SY72 TaxID=2741673 RepID=UPI0015730E38|nr:hypothetical protein [Tabrizicola sp. SY72]NTT85732.1 hypothetical protein [Tabrizicola sp. SY72]